MIRRKYAPKEILGCKVNGVSQKPPSVLCSIHQANPKGFVRFYFQHDKQLPCLTPFCFTVLKLVLIVGAFFISFTLSFQSSSIIIFSFCAKQYEYSSCYSQKGLISLKKQSSPTDSNSYYNIKLET